MLQSTKKIKKFDAQVDRVLDLMINSIYTNKEIFLRELISNASDACDKFRYQAISNSSLLKNDSEALKIKVDINQKEHSISISDNGIGMNEEDIISNLGTIANSGTQKFLEHFDNDKSNNLKLIGQFGVGFYSAYMVSDSIKVISSKAGGVDVYEWNSDGKKEYSIERSSNKLKQGTIIILKIKNSESEFLKRDKVKDIIMTYSDHIAFPIELSENNDKGEIVNKAAAIWTRRPSEISKKEYEEFYKHISNLYGTPLITLHHKVEGVIEYTTLLFIPDTKPFDLFHPDRKTKVKLYIKKVFISEEGNELVPSYLRFLRGIVDSEDLPLNISRESLQHNQVVQKIRSSITKKVLGTLKAKSEKGIKEYELFWKNFREVLKEGLCDNMLEEKRMLLEICKFQSTTSGGNFISLDQYISNMTEGQDKIYFLNGNNLEELKKNPQLEGFKKRGIEVLLLNDHVDNFWVNVVRQYNNKDFQSITNEKIDLNKIKNINEEQIDYSDKKNLQKYSTLIEFVKKTLSNKIRDVVVSSKLISSPACISVTEGGINPRMEKFLMEQNQLNSKSARIFEINPCHKIFQQISDSLKNKSNEDEINKSMVEVVYSQACLIEGDTIDNPSDFSYKLTTLLERVGRQ